MWSRQQEVSSNVLTCMYMCKWIDNKNSCDVCLYFRTCASEMTTRTVVSCADMYDNKNGCVLTCMYMCKWIDNKNRCLTTRPVVYLLLSIYLRCSVLQCVAVCCSAAQRVSIHWRVVWQQDLLSRQYELLSSVLTCTYMCSWIVNKNSTCVTE